MIDFNYNIITQIFVNVIKAVLWLAEAVYGLFFAVSKVELFTGTVVYDFIKRAQLIIGIFVLFRLVVTVLKGIVDPDTFTDSKNGAKNLVVRVITSLVILTLVIPMNVPGSSTYAQKVREHGLLFGTLYDLQNRILSNNTLAKLVFGINDDTADTELVIPTDTEIVANEDTKGNLINTQTVEEARKSFKATFSMNIIKAFYSWRDDIECKSNSKFKYDGKKNVSYSELKRIYTTTKEPNDILKMAHLSCDTSNGKKESILEVNQIIPLLMAIAFSAFFFSFMFDVVVRAAKLAILRIIAPIPIISYINPKGSDSAFDSWSKLLISTYIDLFVRISIIYLIIYMSSQLLSNITLKTGEGGVLNFFAVCIIIIGLLIFAKQAPKFIKEVLGIKGDGGDLFGGIKEAVLVGAGIRGVGADLVTGTGALGMKLGNKWNKNAFTKGAGLALGGLGGAIGGLFHGLAHQGTRYYGNNKPATWSDVKSTWEDTNQDRETYAENILYPKAKRDDKERGKAFLGFDPEQVNRQHNQKEANEALKYNKEVNDTLEQDRKEITVSDGFKNSLNMNIEERETGKMLSADGQLIDFNVARSADDWKNLINELTVAGNLSESRIVKNAKAMLNETKNLRYQEILSMDKNDRTTMEQAIVENAENLIKVVDRNKDNRNFADIRSKLTAPIMMASNQYDKESANLFTVLDTSYKQCLQDRERLNHIEDTDFYKKLTVEERIKVEDAKVKLDTYIEKHQNLYKEMIAPTQHYTETFSLSGDVLSQLSTNAQTTKEIDVQGIKIDLESKLLNYDYLVRAEAEMKRRGATDNDLSDIRTIINIKQSEILSKIAPETIIDNASKELAQGVDPNTSVIRKTLKDEIDYARGNAGVKEFKPIIDSVTASVENPSFANASEVEHITRTIQFKEFNPLSGAEKLANASQPATKPADKKDK